MFYPSDFVHSSFWAFTGSLLLVIAQWMMSLASKTAPCGDTTVMESISLNRLTSTTPHPQRKARTKRQVSDFQKRLETEPQRPAEPNDISNQKLKELSKLHFHFYVCSVCMTHNTRWLSCHAMQMSSPKSLILGSSCRVERVLAVEMHWSVHSISSAICKHAFGWTNQTERAESSLGWVGLVWVFSTHMHFSLETCINYSEGNKRLTVSFHRALKEEDETGSHSSRPSQEIAWHITSRNQNSHHRWNRSLPTSIVLRRRNKSQWMTS